MSAWELVAVITAVWLLGFVIGAWNAVRHAMPDPDDLRIRSPRVIDLERREWFA